MSTEAGKVTREHVETFVADRALQARDRLQPIPSPRELSAFLVEEGELQASPMARVKPPSVLEEQVSVIADGDLRGLLKAAEGTDLEDRQDTAMIRLLVDSGIRAAELVNPRLGDLDLQVGYLQPANYWQ
jgi:site-specific recombinase XerC